MIHQLPTEAQLGPDADHARIRRVSYVYAPDGLQEIQVDYDYGTVDDAGEFVARSYTDAPERIIRDIATFKDEAFDRPSPAQPGQARRSGGSGPRGGGRLPRRPRQVAGAGGG